MCVNNGGTFGRKPFCYLNNDDVSSIDLRVYTTDVHKILKNDILGIP